MEKLRLRTHGVRIWLSLVVIAAAGSCLQAQGKTIHKIIVVPAPRAEVWKAWTTSQGVRSFFAPGARIETRIGGAYEVYFETTRPKGEQGTEGSRLLSFVPERMLSFEWGIPPHFKEVRKQAHTLWNRTWVVVFFRERSQPGSGPQTEIELWHEGFGDSPQWDEVRAYLDRGWDGILRRLVKLFS